MANPSLVPYTDVCKSVLQLRHVSTALSSFHHHFDDLQSHLDSISSSINSLLTPHILHNSPITPPVSQNSPIPKQSQISPPISEIVTLCKSMKGNTLRKYILAHLSEPKNLISEVTAALNQCPNVPKLVLNCVGQFYILGINAYKKNPGLNRLRQASILMLQLFLPLASESGNETEGLVREEAGKGAVAWRKRMMSESGIRKASETDAKGLLLFMGCFGVPEIFEDDDLLDLVKASNGREISGLLCQSSILVKKMKGSSFSGLFVFTLL